MALISANFQSSGLRQKVDGLMDILWAGGLNNPMDAIEQLSYLIFLRLLSENDDSLAAMDKNYQRIFSGDWVRYAWGNFVTLTGDELFNSARDAIEKMHELPGMSETGRLLFNRATLKVYDRPTLRAIIQSINEMDLNAHEGLDLKGDMYEYLLGKLSASGTNGQFRTPRHMIEMIVRLVDPQPGKTIADPACGTAGFLIAVLRYLLEKYTSKGPRSYPGDLLTPANWKFLEERAMTGFDNDANMVKIAILNLYLHGLQKADIRFFNPLTVALKGGYPGQLFDYILANPPFAGKIQQESILVDINLDSRNTELLFLKWFIDHLAPGGRAGVIVPNGVLFSANKAAKKVREQLLNECDLQAVINLPSGVFKPYSGVGTAVLVFEKPNPGPLRPAATSPKSATSISLGSDRLAADLGEEVKGKSVWFYDISADGYSLDDKRAPQENNDIPDVLAKWATRAEGRNPSGAGLAYRVPLATILADADMSLSAGRYRVVTSKATIHDTPQEILAEVLAMENEIASKIKSLIDKIP
jgi:type I restriction enzyme M protein